MIDGELLEVAVSLDVAHAFGLGCGGVVVEHEGAYFRSGTHLTHGFLHDGGEGGGHNEGQLRDGKDSAEQRRGLVVAGAVDAVGPGYR